MSEADKITCQICGGQVHSIEVHLKREHSDTTLDQYKERFPHAPLMSEYAMNRLAEKALEIGADLDKVEGVKAEMVTTAASIEEKRGYVMRPLHEVFDLGSVKAAMNARGEPIPVRVITEHGSYEDLIPSVDENYIFDIDLVKLTLMAFEKNMPLYMFGHAGVGKTTILEQACARTKRPFLRVQHTANTEESHIAGQWTVKDGHTVFELGPLAVAMKFGLVYCADEYDFAMPSVLSVYQAVLEGKALVIKEADEKNRVIRPHPNFRFVATGNTNGAGDETGLYQGTNIQNAANYERFAIVKQVEYMPKKQEIGIIMGQAGIAKEDAEKLVDFATEVRKAYDSSKIGSTISPRALINAAKIGMLRGDFKIGLTLAFTNRLTKVDREVVSQYGQRIFG